MILGISVIRWILILMSVIIIAQNFIAYFKKEVGKSLLKLILTLLIWGVILMISLFPDFAYYISEKLGMGKNLNTLIFFGFVVVFLILFRILSLIEKIEKQITKIIREMAIKEGKK